MATDVRARSSGGDWWPHADRDEVIRVNGGYLNEAYERFHRTGPEWGEDQLTNHGPMAVEVLVRRGRSDAVDRWTDRYIRRLDALPAATGRITDADWADALGDGRRIGDWTAYFTRLLAEEPWRQVLATWWPRLLPGIVAGATHGVIRVGHVVRALLAGAQDAPALDELAHALAFWAARARTVPVSAVPSGRLDALAALDALPRIPVQHGTVAERFGRLSGVPDWPGSASRLRPAAGPEDVRARLSDLVTAATRRYLTHGHGQPVLLVHTATAPNAVLHTLPALPPDLWEPSLTAIWTATAAIFSAYAPAHGRAPGASGAPGDSGTGGAEAGDGPGTEDPRPGAAPGVVAGMLDRAVAHGDEHVIKFTDTAAEVYVRTGHPDAIAAAARVARLIPPAG